MSYIKHKANLFLGVAELNRMQKFFEDDGYKTLFLKNTSAFGVFKYESDPNFNNFKLVEDVAGSGNFKIENDSFAFDSLGNIISQKPISAQSVPNDSAWYWVKIGHQYKTLEQGSVSVDASGNLTGVNTSFLDVLRGEPNFPSKVNFPNSSKNSLDYGIVEVINNTSALLSGTGFIAESGLDYQVVGTFTPGHVASNIDKYPFQYDSCIISLIPESSMDEAPNKTYGEEFYIARVKNVGGSLIVQDKRLEIHKSNSEFNLTNIVKDSNPLIGVESSKFMNEGTSQDHNLVKVGFGMRTSGWSIDAASRAITFSSTDLEAGKYKSTSQFSDGELNGWRIYYKDGSFSEIANSEISGTAIKCTVKEVDPSKLTVNDVLVVTPAVGSIELRSISDGGEGTIPNIEKTFSYQASDGFGIMDLALPESTYSYIIEYRYVKGGESSEWLQIPSDTVNGYYDEASFDSEGNLDQGAATRVTYTSSDTNGFIGLKRSPDSYVDYVRGITTGDKFGYGVFDLDNGNPENVFTVGEDDFVQRCQSVRGGAGSPMTTDQFIGLTIDNNVRTGNTFTFIFNVGISNSGFGLTIRSGYESLTSPGDSIYSFTEEDFDYPFNFRRAVIIKCYFNGTAWEAYPIERDINNIGDIKMISSIDMSDFSSSGLGVSGKDHQGWAICNGSNGTFDMRERFIVSSNYNTIRDGNYGKIKTSDYNSIGEQHGASSYTLSGNQSGIQNHRHGSGTYTMGTHTHGVNINIAKSGEHNHVIRSGSNGSAGYNGTGILASGNPGGSNGTGAVGTGTATKQWVIDGGWTGQVGGHTHNVKGDTGTNSTSGINGFSEFASSSALEDFDNRPSFIAMGFLQRVRRT
jgi:hypothetical protein